MKTRNSLLSIISASVIVFASCTNNPRTVDDKASAEAVSDNKVQEQAAAENYEQLTRIADLLIQEVRLGDIAQTNSSSSAVRKSAADLKQKSQAMYNELSALAQAKAIVLPELPGNDGTAFVTKMQQLKGTQFDTEYSSITTSDHTQLLDMLQSTAASSNDADIREWANKALSVLKTHETPAS
ncbi:DUF4142 domain-containing protein [Rurimicrobium arvi]|uniref:DUF4142 domain-containing protein n=1 Tax=Rurimicrobium arvi TaxID=2049916 RepID=A0ABP8MVQ9_9BACT